MEAWKIVNCNPVYTHERERRRYSRVAVNRTGCLYAGGKEQHFAKIRDLSIGGACIKGKSSFSPGLRCELELQEDGRHSSRVFRLSAQIVRKNYDELALEFIDMDKESYMFLQTVLLYHVDDPLSIAAEFQDEFSNTPLQASC